METLLTDVHESSLLSYLVLENPWILAMALTTVAAVAGTLGWRYRRGGGAVAGLVALAAAVAVVVAAKVIQTPAEQLKQATRTLVAATLPPHDDDALDRLLRDDVSLDVTGTTVYSSKKQIIELIGRLEQAYRLDAWTILWQRAGAGEAGVGKTLFNINTRVVIEGDPIFAGGRMANTTWLLEWSGGRAGRPWRLKKISWLALRDQSPSPSLLP